VRGFSCHASTGPCCPHNQSHNRATSLTSVAGTHAPANPPRAAPLPTVAAASGGGGASAPAPPLSPSPPCRLLHVWHGVAEHIPLLPLLYSCCKHTRAGQLNLQQGARSVCAGAPAVQGCARVGRV